MTTVWEVLADKAPRLIQVGPEMPVLEAIRLMAIESVGAVLVMQAGKLVGIVSERDYARKVILLGKASADTPVTAIMSAPVVTVTRSESVQACMEMMTERRFRHLPVVEGGQVLGLISIGDLVKAVIEEQRREIDQLQRYIAS